jgi:hypothetical protein
VHDLRSARTNLVEAQRALGVANADEDDIAPSEKYVFAGPAGMPPSFDDMRRMRSTIRTDSTRFRWLRRGIALHGANLPSDYLYVAEYFFRVGRVGAIFSTDTLAQGINMPAHAVVIAGNSPALDGQKFRQMAGRAGRRGLDTRGDVVFFGVPSWRALQVRAQGAASAASPRGERSERFISGDGKRVQSVR